MLKKMTKTEMEEKIDDVGVRIERSILDEVLEKAKKEYPYDRIHYYTQAVRAVLVDYIRGKRY